MLVLKVERAGWANNEDISISQKTRFRDFNRNMDNWDSDGEEFRKSRSNLLYEQTYFCGQDNIFLIPRVWKK